MRALLAVLLAGAVLTGCGGGAGGGAPANVLPPLGALAPPAGTQTPLSASAFDDSIGVNLHASYVVGGYDTGFAQWSPILEASGIKHVRDGVCPTFVDVHWCIDTLAPHMNALARAGIKFDLITSMNDGFSYLASYASTLNVAADVEAYEGPNECDASTDCPSDWASVEGAWQQQLWTLRSPSVTVVAPSMTTAQGYAALGNLAPYANVGNIHDFPATNMPESAMSAPEHLQWVQSMTGDEPVWATEDGYNTDPTFANDGVPQVVQERYLPRMLLEHLRLGVMRTYVYQIFDFGPDGGSNMGLLNADYTPKPAWTTLLQLMRLFADTKPAPRTPIALSVTGDTSGTLDDVLFQRSDGSYMLALWLAQSVYDAQTRAVLPIVAENLAVHLPASISSATLTAFGDGGAMTTTVLAGAGGVFTVPVRTTVSVLQFGP